MVCDIEEQRGEYGNKLDICNGKRLGDFPCI
jgi:hypothetical protein